MLLDGKEFHRAPISTDTPNERSLAANADGGPVDQMVARQAWAKTGHDEA